MYVSVWFLVPVTNVKVSNEPARTKLGYYCSFVIRNAKLSNQRTKNVAIRAFSLGK